MTTCKWVRVTEYDDVTFRFSSTGRVEGMTMSRKCATTLASPFWRQRRRVVARLSARQEECHRHGAQHCGRRRDVVTRSEWPCPRNGGRAIATARRKQCSASTWQSDFASSMPTSTRNDGYELLRARLSRSWSTSVMFNMMLELAESTKSPHTRTSQFRLRKFPIRARSRCSGKV